MKHGEATFPARKQDREKQPDSPPCWIPLCYKKQHLSESLLNCYDNLLSRLETGVIYETNRKFNEQNMWANQHTGVGSKTRMTVLRQGIESEVKSQSSCVPSLSRQTNNLAFRHVYTRRKLHHNSIPPSFKRVGESCWLVSLSGGETYEFYYGWSTCRTPGRRKKAWKNKQSDLNILYR